MTTDEFFAEAKRLNLRMLGTPEETRAALDLKDAEIDELKEAYASLFKAYGGERLRWEEPTSMDCASCKYVAPTPHDRCRGCAREIVVHVNYERAARGMLDGNE